MPSAPLSNALRKALSDDLLEEAESNVSHLLAHFQTLLRSADLLFRSLHLVLIWIVGIAGTVYEETRFILRDFLARAVKDAIVYSRKYPLHPILLPFLPVSSSPN